MLQQLCELLLAAVDDTRDPYGCMCMHACARVVVGSANAGMTTVLWNVQATYMFEEPLAKLSGHKASPPTPPPTHAPTPLSQQRQQHKSAPAQTTATLMTQLGFCYTPSTQGLPDAHPPNTKP
jgi:hypothetical protein